MKLDELFYGEEVKMSEIEKLAIRAKNGDKDVFTKATLLIETALYKTAYAILKDDYAVEEAIQNSMINAYNYIKGMKHPEYFKTWITRIVINECKKVLKKKNRREERESENLDNLYKTDKLGYSVHIESVEDKIEMERALDVLNEKERDILMLYFSDNYKVSEIAKLLDISVNTVNSRIQRAKNKLMDYYKGGNKQ